MSKIKWLKPTKAQEKIMEAERKAICDLTVPRCDLEAFNKSMDAECRRLDEAFYQDLMKKCEIESGANWIHEAVEIDYKKLPKLNLSSTPMRVIVV